MANTSVHFPDSVLKRLDELAKQKGLSRNRLIVDACREVLEQQRQWPERFFARDRLSGEEREVLRRSWRDFDEAIESTRKSRKNPPL